MEAAWHPHHFWRQVYHHLLPLHLQLLGHPVWWSCLCHCHLGHQQTQGY